jgi:hypothetical protein
MPKKQKNKVPVSERALVARINRKLREHGEMGELLRKNASQRWWSDLGDYYVVDIRGNYIVNRHVDLESFAKECGCLKPWEALQQ